MATYAVAIDQGTTSSRAMVFDRCGRVVAVSQKEHEQIYQRETAVVWNRGSGEPVHNAIVRQDTRTDRVVEELSRSGGQDRFCDKFGLPLATYFSGPKVR